MTNIVTFPGLGLSFELNRVAFSLFGHDVYWYGIIIALGFGLAVIYCYYNAYRFGLDNEMIFDLLIFATPLSIVGARAYYVIFYQELFRNADGSFNWGDAIAIWDGGMAIYGSIIAAILCVVVFCKVKKVNTLAFLDLGCYGVIIGQAVGRWGNFVNVEAFGGVTELPWRMSAERIANKLWNNGLLESEAAYDAILSGELGVHPTFLYESLWNVIGFFLLVVMARKWRKTDGQIFLSYIIWYGIGRAFIEGLRTDSLYFFETGLRTSQLLGALSAAAALIWLVWRLKKGGPAAAAIPAKKGAADEVDAVEEELQEISEDTEEETTEEEIEVDLEAEPEEGDVEDAIEEEIEEEAEDGSDQT